jgi:hypothetical protein
MVKKIELEGKRRLLDEERESQGELSFSVKNIPSKPEAWSQLMTESSVRAENLEDISKLSTKEYLFHIDNLVRDVISSPDYRDESLFEPGKPGYISDAAWKKLVDGGLLLSALGDRGEEGKQKEVMLITKILSYYSLPLGLTYGIVGALGILTIQSFVTDEEKRKNLLQIIRDGQRVGLGITEPERSGTQALDMASEYEVFGDRVILNGVKHLQGNSLTGGLIVAAVKKGASKKTVGFFFVPQELIDTRITKTQGLSEITYGVNTFDNVELSMDEHFMGEISGMDLIEFQNIFTKSRLLFPGMLDGFTQRLVVESENLPERTKQVESVQASMVKIKSWRLIVEAIFNSTADNIDLENDNSGLVIEADIVKALSSELSALSALELAELNGGMSYYDDDQSALNFFIDVYPFQIFEGSQKFVYSQAAQLFLRGDRKIEPPILSFTKDQQTSFLEYYMIRIKDRVLFNGGFEVIDGELPRSIANLEGDTVIALGKIKNESMSAGIYEQIGRILAWLYALGNINEVDASESQLLLTKKMINKKIRDLVGDYELAKDILSMISEQEQQELIAAGVVGMSRD